MANKNIKTQILEALGLNKVTMAFQAKTTDGTIVVSEAETLEAGTSVSILTEDGTTVPLPTGEYTLEDGTSFSVTEEGVIAEIYEEETAEEMQEEEAEEVPAEEVVDEVVAEVAEATAEIAEAINEATPEEVTPEIAEQVAEIAVAVIEEKAEEVKEEVLSKQMKSVLAIVRKELNKMKKDLGKVKSKTSKLSKARAGEPVRSSKFTKSKKTTIEKPYGQMSMQERYWYNLNN